MKCSNVFCNVINDMKGLATKTGNFRYHTLRRLAKLVSLIFFPKKNKQSTVLIFGVLPDKVSWNKKGV